MKRFFISLLCVATPLTCWATKAPPPPTVPAELFVRKLAALKTFENLRKVLEFTSNADDRKYLEGFMKDYHLYGSMAKAHIKEGELTVDGIKDPVTVSAKGLSYKGHTITLNPTEPLEESFPKLKSLFLQKTAWWSDLFLPQAEASNWLTVMGELMLMSYSANAAWVAHGCMASGNQSSPNCLSVSASWVPRILMNIGSRSKEGDVYAVPVRIACPDDGGGKYLLEAQGRSFNELWELEVNAQSHEPERLTRTESAHQKDESGGQTGWWTVHSVDGQMIVTGRATKAADKDPKEVLGLIHMIYSTCNAPKMREAFNHAVAEAERARVPASVTEK
jgi:hypothetical protein